MTIELQDYEPIVGPSRIGEIRALGRHLQGVRMLHVNSTAVGGGVAEILRRMIPLLREAGIDARWEVLEGDADFYRTTKSFHNGLQGLPVRVADAELEHYLEVNARNAARLPLDAEVLLIHDPQPAALIHHRHERSGTWIWRCHIDAATPSRPLWRFLGPIVAGYDASIWSMPQFTRPLPHHQFLVHPSIDPLAEKNRDLEPEEIEAVLDRLQLPRDLPFVLQVSRFDRFKDPVGVIHAWRLASRYVPCRLVLVGGEATDDPEGAEVIAEVRAAAGDDPLVHVLLLPPTADLEINALQRAAAVVLQKSTREGFGLTVSEAMWKGKPVIGGATGGITVQILDGITGFLVHSVDGAAYRIRQLLSQPDRAHKMGERARALVRERFLITRHLLDYLALVQAVRTGSDDVIAL
ncbi:MAG: glycosyltransferase [Deltaproteobacteria bacterium]|nr:glycosyltransferase [Deltaproteobacteria bacterium]